LTPDQQSIHHQLVEDRNSLMQSVQDVNYRLGAADARLQQLEARANQCATARKTAQKNASRNLITQSMVVEVSKHTN